MYNEIQAAVPLCYIIIKDWGVLRMSSGVLQPPEKLSSLVVWQRKRLCSWVSKL